MTKNPIIQAVSNFQAGTDRERNFRRIVDCFYPPVQRYFARKTLTEDALDLTQETFLSLYSALDGFRGEAQFSTWVFTIARNLRTQWFKRQNRINQLTDGPAESISTVTCQDEELVIIDSEPSSLDQFMHKEVLMRLRKAIEELPDKMRECLMLRLYHDLKYQEIADIMNISIQTVKAHLSQAKQKLREKLGPDFDGIDF